MVSSRLFLKVYLTLLACLAAVALASGVYWRLTMDRDAANLGERRDRFAQEMLPASDDPAQTRLMLERLGNALDADLALYSREGELLASAGHPPSSSAVLRPAANRRSRTALPLGARAQRSGVACQPTTAPATASVEAK